MKEYKGMNFEKWCALDVNDKRKIVYEKTPCGTFTSEDTIDSGCLPILQNATIDKVVLICNEWHIWLS